MVHVEPEMLPARVPVKRGRQSMEREEVTESPFVQADFKALSKKDPDFNTIFQNSNGHLDFQDPDTCVVLTKAILKVNFGGLQLDLPDDRLCPPVPNRWEYVQWMQGLIDSTAPDYSQGYDSKRQIEGLDIGTGASAIYTLLLLQSRPNWRMCITDIDKKNLDFALGNLALNNMTTRVTALQTTPEMPLIPLKYLADRLDFTVCNPPFFTDEAEMNASLAGEGKEAKPSAVCTGSKTEMIYPGGDLGFVIKMVNESLLLRDKVQWYSSMLGKMSSAKAIVELLKAKGVGNWAVGCLDPGGKTKRWVVAWSFGDYRPRNDIARMRGTSHDWLPFPTKYKVLLPEDSAIKKTAERIDTRLSALDIRWIWDPELNIGNGEAPDNVWKRAYRREQQKRSKAGEKVLMQKDAEDMPVALAFRITTVEQPAKEVIVDWLRGTDVVLWESFCGMIHTCVKQP